MICPYCNVREIAYTLNDASGSYSMCRPCGIQWGMKLRLTEPIAAAGSEVRLLEYWYELPCAEVAR